MKSLKSSFVFLIFLFLNCNLDKTTTSHGRVYNYISGKPIAGMRVTLTGYDGNNPHDSVIPDPCETVEAKTDHNGEYELEVGCSGMDKVSIYVGNTPNVSPFYNGFFGEKASAKLRLGKSNIIDFQVDSLDGKIVFNLYNTHPAEDTVYLLVHCNALYDLDYYYCGGHRTIAVPAGSANQYAAYVTANRYIKYYWDTKPFTKTGAAFVDSVYCARNDSVNCVISF